MTAYGIQFDFPDQAPTYVGQTPTGALTWADTQHTAIWFEDWVDALRVIGSYSPKAAGFAHIVEIKRRAAVSTILADNMNDPRDAVQAPGGPAQEVTSPMRQRSYGSTVHARAGQGDPGQPRA